jgi:hypothetical protein
LAHLALATANSETGTGDDVAEVDRCPFLAAENDGTDWRREPANGRRLGRRQ